MKKKVNRKKDEDGGCSQEVSDGTGWHWNRCSRKAVVWVDGKGFCKQHNPKEKEKKDKIHNLEYKIGWLRKDMVVEQARIGKLIIEQVETKGGVCIDSSIDFSIKEISAIKKKIDRAVRELAEIRKEK